MQDSKLFLSQYRFSPRLNTNDSEIKDFLNLSYFNKNEDKKDIENFNKHLKNYLESIDKHKADSSENALVANFLKPFFENLGFNAIAQFRLDKNHNALDLALQKDKIEVLLEAKKPDNAEMIYHDGKATNTKALAQSIYYYYKLRKGDDLLGENYDLKFIIITDFYQFFIFKAVEFEKFFYKNKAISEIIKSYEKGNKQAASNLEELYKKLQDILASNAFINGINGNLIEFDVYLNTLYIDLRIDFLKEKNQAILYKIFNRDFLFAEFKPDANTINKRFYDELLFILGLKESSGKIIQDEAQNHSFASHIIDKLAQKYPLKPLDSHFENAMGLIILWLNRILFLKIAESNLKAINSEFEAFLSFKEIPNYEILSHLFFEVLNKQNRAENEKFKRVPYFNSSLFSLDDRENPNNKKYLLNLKDLDSNLQISYYPQTCLKDLSKENKKKAGNTLLLAYLFEFLDSWDFSEIKDCITDADKSTKRSILGLIFEKFNGYKEGSFYTPSKNH